MTTPLRVPNRWVVAAMGTLLQLCLGTVYAWSYFQSLLVASYRWTYTDTAWAFSLLIFTLGISAAWAGVNLPRFGPRKLAMAGGIHLGMAPLDILSFFCIGLEVFRNPHPILRVHCSL